MADTESSTPLEVLDAAGPEVIGEPETEAPKATNILQLVSSLYSRLAATPNPHVVEFCERVSLSTAPITVISLRSNVPERFNSRLNDVDCAVLVEAAAAFIGELEELDLGFNYFSDGASLALSKALQHLPNLRSLVLASNAMKTEGVEALADAIRSHPTLYHVDISDNCDVGDAGCMAMAGMLQENGVVQSLDLSRCDIGMDALIALSLVLRSNTSLRTLLVEMPAQHSTQHEPIVHIAEMLAVNESLRVLGLKGHRLGDTGAQILARGLMRNRGLHILDVQQNQISGDGGCAIAMALAKSRTLSAVDISFNRIGDLGASAFAKSLISNRSVVALRISQNKVKCTGLQALAHAAALHPALAEITLWGNIFAPASAETWRQLLSAETTKIRAVDIELYLQDGVAYVAKLTA